MPSSRWFRALRGVGANARLGLRAGGTAVAGMASGQFLHSRSHAAGCQTEGQLVQLEQRVQSLEARLTLMQKSSEEIRAIETIKLRAEEHGLDIGGGTIRRTSSRFCLGVEHGDYNGTELFGVGTDRFIWLAYKPNSSGKVRIFSHNCAEDGVIEFTPGTVPAPKSPEIADTWARFVYGVDYTLNKEGFATGAGFDAVIVGNIPGGGMSRSASLIVNLMLTMLELNDRSLPEGDFRIVDMSQSVENDYVGTPCGNLDQIMIYYAKEGMGTRYNPKTREVSYVPLGLDAEDFRIAALDTGTVRHGLEKSTYKIRVEETQRLVKLLQEKGYPIKQLADVKDEATFAKIVTEFGTSEPDLIKRLRYLYFAQKRFEVMVQAWTKGDIETVGRIFREDGIGLRDEYVISGPELETMCDVARTVPGVVGERMLGGGDKGAAGAILHRGAEQQLRYAVERGYKRAVPNQADRCAVHTVKVCQGVSVMRGLI